MEKKERGRRDQARGGQKEKEDRRRRGPWLLPSPSGLCVDLSIQQTSAVGQPATPMDASGPFKRTHTHTQPQRAVWPGNTVAAREFSVWLNLKTTTTASCAGVRRRLGWQKENRSGPTALNCSITRSPAAHCLCTREFSLMDSNERQRCLHKCARVRQRVLMDPFRFKRPQQIANKAFMGQICSRRNTTVDRESTCRCER